MRLASTKVAAAACLFLLTTMGCVDQVAGECSSFEYVLSSNRAGPVETTTAARVACTAAEEGQMILDTDLGEEFSCVFHEKGGVGRGVWVPTHNKGFGPVTLEVDASGGGDFTSLTAAAEWINAIPVPIAPEGVHVDVRAGTYAETQRIELTNKAQLGNNGRVWLVRFEGDIASPNNVVISPATSGSTGLDVYTSMEGQLSLRGMHVTTSAQDRVATGVRLWREGPVVLDNMEVSYYSRGVGHTYNDAYVEMTQSSIHDNKQGFQAYSFDRSAHAMISSTTFTNNLNQHVESSGASAYIRMSNDCVFNGAGSSGTALLAENGATIIGHDVRLAFNQIHTVAHATGVGTRIYLVGDNNGDNRIQIDCGNKVTDRIMNVVNGATLKLRNVQATNQCQWVAVAYTGSRVDMSNVAHDDNTLGQKWIYVEQGAMVYTDSATAAASVHHGSKGNGFVYVT